MPLTPRTDSDGRIRTPRHKPPRSLHASEHQLMHSDAALENMTDDDSN